jgi:hypothetical protein
MKAIWGACVLFLINNTGSAAEQGRIPSNIIQQFATAWTDPMTNQTDAENLLEQYPNLVYQQYCIDHYKEVPRLARRKLIQYGEEFILETRCSANDLADCLQNQISLHTFLAEKKISDAIRTLNPPPYGTPIERAAFFGNLPLVTSLLAYIPPDKKNELINPSDPGQALPLLSAICSGNPDIVKSLLSNGANPLKKLLGGYTFVTYAALLASKQGNETLQDIYGTLQPPYQQAAYETIKKEIIQAVALWHRTSKSQNPPDGQEKS